MKALNYVSENLHTDISYRTVAIYFPSIMCLHF